MIFTPAPKTKRQVDATITEQARERDGACLYGLLHKDGCGGGLDGHHMDKRSQGGHDVLSNVITLCRKHHGMAEARRIDVRELKAIMTLFHKYVYEGIKAWTTEFLEAQTNGRTTAT